MNKLTSDLANTMANDLAANLLTGTCTNATTEAKPFTLRDLHKARFTVMGFEIQENSLMPENCIAFVPKNDKDVIWYNMETGKMYCLDTKKLRDEMWGERIAYDPTR